MPPRLPWAGGRWPWLLPHQVQRCWLRAVTGRGASVATHLHRQLPHWAGHFLCPILEKQPGKKRLRPQRPLLALCQQLFALAQGPWVPGVTPIWPLALWATAGEEASLLAPAILPGCSSAREWGRRASGEPNPQRRKEDAASQHIPSMSCLITDPAGWGREKGCAPDQAKQHPGPSPQAPGVGRPRSEGYPPPPHSIYWNRVGAMAASSPGLLGAQQGAPWSRPLSAAQWEEPRAAWPPQDHRDWPQPCLLWPEVGVVRLQ